MFHVKIYTQLLKITFLLFFMHGCSQMPGINKNPKNQIGSKKIEKYYTIKDVEIAIIKINNLNETEINNFNTININELDYSIKEFESIYNYKYSYVLGASDVISINLSETEDIDNLGEGVYHAVITDANGCKFTSVDYILSLTAEAELESSEIDVFPNPMKDKCTIVAEIDDWSMYAIRLVDLQGQILDNALQMTNVAKGSVSCEINNVVSGFYYLIHS